MRKLYFFVVVAACLFVNVLYSQCSLYPVPLSSRAANSSVIIEGKILSKQSFWNAARDYIYTSNLVQVNQVLKGALTSTRLEIITEGGEIGLQRQTVEPSLQLKPEDEGVFFLNLFEQASQYGYPVYRSYGDMQGFIKFNLSDNTANEPFKKYTSINSDLYPELETTLGTDLPDFVNPNSGKYSSSTIASVSGISPTNITAGTSSILTITGSGFGATQGTSTVEFLNADDGGATFIQPHSSQYVSWSNTQIQVMVPARASTVSGTAGTGQVRVTVAGSPTLSTQTLTVDYGEINLYYSTNNTIYNTRHVDLNGSSGITWQMYTSFDANSAAKTAFLSSFQTWRCNTFINWVLGSTTSTNVIALDGVNVVRFDISTELPSGVLGRCTSYFSGCITGTVVNWYIDELDICFDDPATSTITWQFGPSLATGVQYDFESVSLHELGHGHQLTHVINSSDVMHYAIANAQNKRSLITNNINAGNDVMSRNVSPGVCSMPAMTALNPTICGISAPTASFNVTSPVCVGQSVSLNDLSSGSPSAWSWTMTGGSTASSTLQNTSTSYASPGTYSISLAATNGFGTSATLTKTISVVAVPTINVSSATICSGTSTMLTATGATSYTWNPGGLTGVSQNLNPAATTAYTVTGSNGTCSGNTTATVTVNSTPTVNVPDAFICAGSSTLMTASGATTYTWMPGGLTGASQNLNPAVTTVYTVTGSIGACTSNIFTFSITVSSTPTISVPDATICSGTSTLLTAGGATTYTWNPGNLTGAAQNLNPVATTVYTITGNTGGCMASTTATVTAETSPTIIVPNASICSGASTLLTAGGATSYTWNPGALMGASQNLNPLATTVYTVTGTSGNCNGSTTTTVTVIATPTVSVPDAVICSGSPTLLTASGAISYTWQPGALSGASQNLGPAATTVYTVTGNTSGCTGNTTLTVTVNTTPTISVPNGGICSGASTLVTASGATSYTWNPGALVGAAQNLNPAATTIYTVTGSIGTCTNSSTAVISVTTTPTVSVPNGDICSGTSTLMTASGAISYTWNPGNLTGASQNLNPASTTVYTVSGSIGSCLASTTMTVSVTTTPTVSVPNASICFGNSVMVMASGATSYTWNPGNLTGATQNLSPGSTTVYTVTGSNGNCTNAISSTITVNALPFLFTLASPSNICNGASSNLLGAGAITYTWVNGVSGFNLTGSSVIVSPTVSTLYTVSASDGTCINTSTVFLTVSPNPTITVNSATICAGATATITANGAGTYTWSPGGLTGATQNLTPASTTIYTVTGDLGICSGTKTLVVTVNPTPAVNVPNGSICAGSATVMTASGATSYLWNPGGLSGTTRTLNPSATTVYTVTGSLGSCSNTATFILTVNPNPTLSVPSLSTCLGTPTVMTANGANTYTWNPGNLTGASQVLNPATTTVYTVTGTYSNTGCNSSIITTLHIRANPVIFAISSPTVVCSGKPTTLSAGGGLTYTWSPGALSGANVVVTPTASTIYTVTGFDAFCNSSTTVLVAVNPNPTFFVSSASICSGTSAALGISGSASSYTWNPGNLIGSTQVVMPLVTTVYTITGENTFGCTSINTTTVSVTPTPTLNLTASLYTVCPGKTSTLTVTGATNYSWMPGTLSGTNVAVSPTLTTNYVVVGYNGSCSSSTSTTIFTYIPPTVVASSSPAAICNGASATLAASGAASYTWTPGGTGNIITVTPSSSTSYSVTGTSVNGCTATASTNVIVFPTPTINATASQTVLCQGNTTTLTVTGGSSYTWMPGNLTGSMVVVTPLIPTLYQVTGSNGTCTAFHNIVILTNPVPTITAIGTQTSICSGKTVTLTAFGAATMTWNPGNMVGNTVTVSPVVTTIYTVSGTNPTGCFSSRTITVNVTPTPTINVVISPTVICIGKTTTITASGAGTYIWNPVSITGPSIAVTPSVATIYSVTGSTGSCTSTQQVSLNPNPSPAVVVLTPTSTICSGNMSTLSAAGADAYVWNPGNIAGVTVTVSPAVTTIYTVTGSYTTTGCGTDASTTVSVTPTPTVSAITNPVILCEGSTSTLTANGAGSYTWNPGNLTGNTVTVSPLTNTTYTIDGENSGCFGSALVTVSVTICDNINEFKALADLKVYPNPNQGLVIVNFGKAFSGEISLYNAIGQVLFTHKAYETERLEFDLDVYPNGVYLMKISSDKDEWKYIKLVKE